MFKKQASCPVTSFPCIIFISCTKYRIETIYLLCLWHLTNKPPQINIFVRRQSHCYHYSMKRRSAISFRVPFQQCTIVSSTQGILKSQPEPAFCDFLLLARENQASEDKRSPNPSRYSLCVLQRSAHTLLPTAFSERMADYRSSLINTNITVLIVTNKANHRIFCAFGAYLIRATFTPLAQKLLMVVAGVEKSPYVLPWQANPSLPLTHSIADNCRRHTLPLLLPVPNTARIITFQWGVNRWWIPW